MNQTTIPAQIDGFANMEVKTPETLRKVKDRVRFLLEKYPSTRGDDRVLIWRYIYVYEPDIKMKFSDFKALMRMTSPESIRRVRQKIQEGGEFLPTDKTVRKRRRREEIIRAEIGGI